MSLHPSPSSQRLRRNGHERRALPKQATGGGDYQTVFGILVIIIDIRPRAIPRRHGPDRNHICHGRVVVCTIGVGVVGATTTAAATRAAAGAGARSSPGRSPETAPAATAATR